VKRGILVIYAISLSTSMGTVNPLG
jgi:hypothetical protein